MGSCPRIGGVTKKAPTTAATQALTRLGLPFTPHPYEHDRFVEGYGLEAARELGVEPERVFKTLVVEADAHLVVAVVPVSAMLDLKALAAVVGAKRAVMAPPDLAERRTGYVVGGISPFGQRTRLPLVLDATATGFGTVFVSGGRRGFDIEVAPADLISATDGRVAAIGVPR
jgi:Cys-tRNA(Pro)/Cys-tRNA(Cys) deacylase